MRVDSTKEIRLNLGCAGRPLPGYINVDLDTLEQMKERYPSAEFPQGVEIHQFDIFNLPYQDGVVREVVAESLLDHLSFIEERKFFYEMKRVLKTGGLFVFSVPDFEKIVKDWLKAKDEWKDFFRDDPEAIARQHWFGQYSYSTKSRWGYLTASIWGSQKGLGQFHKNCFTVPKIRAILKRINFKELDILYFNWKGDRDPMIRVKAQKL